MDETHNERAAEVFARLDRQVLNTIAAALEIRMGYLENVVGPSAGENATLWGSYRDCLLVARVIAQALRIKQREVGDGRTDRHKYAVGTTVRVVGLGNGSDRTHAVWPDLGIEDGELVIVVGHGHRPPVYYPPAPEPFYIVEPVDDRQLIYHVIESVLEEVTDGSGS